MNSQSLGEIYRNLQEHILEVCNDPKPSRSMTLVTLSRIYSEAEKLLDGRGPQSELHGAPLLSQSSQRLLLRLGEGIEVFKDSGQGIPENFVHFLCRDLIEAVQTRHGPEFRSQGLAS